MKKIRITEAQANILMNIPLKRKVRITTSQLNAIRESLGDSISNNFKKEFNGHKPKPQFESAINEGGLTVEILELIKGVIDFILAELNNDTSHGLSPIFKRWEIHRGELFQVLSDAGLIGMTFYQYTYNEKIQAIKKVIGGIYNDFNNKSESVRLGEAEQGGGIKPEQLIGALDLPSTRADVDWNNRKEYSIPSLTDGDAASIVNDKEFFTGRQFTTRIGKVVKQDGYVKEFAKRFGEMPLFSLVGNRIEVLNPEFKAWQQQYIQGKGDALNQMGTTEATGAPSSGSFTAGMSAGPFKGHDDTLDPSTQIASAADSMLTDSESPFQEIIGLPIGTNTEIFQVASVEDKVIGKGGTIDYLVKLTQEDETGRNVIDSHLLYKIDLKNRKVRALFNHDFESLHDAERAIPVQFHANLNKIGNVLFKQAQLNVESTTSGGISASGGAIAFDANALPDLKEDDMSKGGKVKIDDCTKLNNNKVAQNGGCSEGDDGVVSIEPH
tara:strand:- start:291 stop:1781 length:1491 start_codon:yes stop_codon:yes gene_type:complete